MLEDEKGEQALSKISLGVNGSASGEVSVCVCVLAVPVRGWGI